MSITEVDLAPPGEFPFSSFAIAMDAILLLEWLTPGSVNCIITDPAYVSLEKHRAVGSAKCRRLTSWFPLFQNERYERFMAAAYRALANNSHCYIMCDEETADIIKPIGIAAGFKFWKSVIWDKVVRGQGYHYANTHESVLFFEKGARQLNDRKHVSVVRNIPKLMGGGPKRGVERKLGELYPTEKPVPLYWYFLENSISQGDLVVDPFCGSGNSALAALSLGCRYIGGDISQAAMRETQHRARLYYKYLEAV